MFLFAEGKAKTARRGRAKFPSPASSALRSNVGWGNLCVTESSYKYAGLRTGNIKSESLHSLISPASSKEIILDILSAEGQGSDLTAGLEIFLFGLEC
jgi:hypothetical protein